MTRTIEDLTEAELASLRDGLLETASIARTDAAVFMEFVMRDFSTTKPVKVAPHQRVGLDFILAHDRCVNMWPAGAAKTFTMAALTLWLLGNNPTLRGAVVSASETQAKKILAVVREYIETSAELRLVFPGLQRSQRESEPWTQTAITVDRPPGIKDASLSAFGQDSKSIIGSRLNWIIVDDLLNDENTATKDQREKVGRWFDSSVRSRLDPKGGRIVVTNTAWHPDDVVHRLQKMGWATMRMDLLGDITIHDDVDNERSGNLWDSPLLRPSTQDENDPACRLVAHDPDPTNSVPLWPERYSIDYINRILRRDHLPQQFNQLYRNLCRDDQSSMCKLEYLDTCLALARQEGIYSLVSEYRGPNLTFTGLDLAVSPGEEHDDTAFFTIEVRPDGVRVILDIDVGQWDGPTILKKLFEKQARYNSIVRVENNAAQEYIRQFALSQNKSIPIKGHTTGRTKAHAEHGVPGIFLELMNGAWRIPNTVHGEKHPAVRRFVDACLYYTASTSSHTDDVLMAAYFARTQAVDWRGAGGQRAEGNRGAGSVMDR